MFRPAVYAPVLLTLFLPGCDLAPAKPKTAEDTMKGFTKLTKGISKKEVVALLGSATSRPDSNTLQGNLIRFLTSKGQSFESVEAFSSSESKTSADKKQGKSKSALWVYQKRGTDGMFFLIIVFGDDGKLNSAQGYVSSPGELYEIAKAGGTISKVDKSRKSKSAGKKLDKKTGSKSGGESTQ